MKYIRTKDGRIIDLERFINEEKDTPYYKDFEFEEISKDGQLKWTAIGTEKNSIKDQIGRRCHFSATLNNEVIKQADTIEELFDRFVIVFTHSNNEFCYRNDFFKIGDALYFIDLYKSRCKILNTYGAIWTDKGLIYVAKMKGILPNGEIDWELL